MAFSFEQTGNRGNTMNIIGVVVVVVILVAGTYYLFFAPTPAIDVVVPPELESVSNFSEIDLDTGGAQDVIDSLEEHVPGVEPGPSGRDNPFAPF